MTAPIPYIAHFDLDSFFVSVEIKNNPSLKGKPVVVGGYERGVVAACSYEARKFGIQSAMPMKKAMQMCPQLIVTNASRDQYSKYSRWVTDIIAAKVPLFEKASIDEFYIDLSGLDKNTVYLMKFSLPPKKSKTNSLSRKVSITEIKLLYELHLYSSTDLTKPCFTGLL